MLKEVDDGGDDKYDDYDEIDDHFRYKNGNLKYVAKYDDGKLLEEKSWFHNGQQLVTKTYLINDETWELHGNYIMMTLVIMR